MKKSVPFYVCCWAVVLAAFIAVSFLIPHEYDSRFWLSLAIMIVAFCINLGCSFVALKAENAQKTFYRIPLIRISLYSMLFVGVAGVIMNLLPLSLMWLASVLSIIVNTLCACAIIKAGAAANIVEDVDRNVKNKTEFIKSLTVDAQNLIGHAQGEKSKECCRAVYESVRYSDPMSSPELADIETALNGKMSEFAVAVDANNSEKIQKLSTEITTLVKDRNNKCKALK